MKDYDKALDTYLKAEDEFDKLEAPSEDKLYLIDRIRYIFSVTAEEE